MKINEISDTKKNLKVAVLHTLVRSKAFPYILLSIVFLALMTPLLVKPGLDIYDSRDENAYHYPTILEFRDEFPNPDLIDYHSATTPLYHLTLTVSSFIFGKDLIPLRFVNMFIGLILLLIIYRYFSGRGEMVKGLFFALIFMLSPYFIGPSIRLSTDNMALLFAILSILTMDTTPKGVKYSVLSNIFILLAVLTRQIYVWLIGVYVIYGFFRYNIKTEFINLVKNNLPVIIPTTGIAFFIFLWKGLNPPYFVEAHTSSGLNWDAPIYAISLIGIYGAFFYLWFFQWFKEDHRRVITILLLIGLGIGILLLHPFSNEYDTLVRGGALCLAATHLPMVLSTSVVYWLLFPVGLVLLYYLLRQLFMHKEYLMIICIVLWLMTNLVNARTYQKYYEPFIFFFLGYTFITLKKENWRFWIGPVGLLAGLLLIMIVRFF